MTLRHQSAMDAREARTQGALVAALRVRPRTPYRAVQYALGAKASILSSLLDRASPHRELPPTGHSGRTPHSSVKKSGLSAASGARILSSSAAGPWISRRASSEISSNC